MGFFDFVKKLFGGGKKKPPKQREETFPIREEFYPKREEFIPKAPPPKPLELPLVPNPPKLPEPPIIATPLLKTNVIYVPARIKKGRHIKAYWQAGNTEEPVTMDDIRELLERVKDKNFYTVIVHGIMKNEYPGKEGQNDIWLSYKIAKDTLWDEMEDNPMGDPADWINNCIGANEGREWEFLYSVAIVDN